MIMQRPNKPECVKPASIQDCRSPAMTFFLFVQRIDHLLWEFIL